MSTCPHIANTEFKIANPNLDYYPEECYYCFDDQDTPPGVSVCLSCLFVGCEGDGENGERMKHSELHKMKYPSHNIVLSIKRNTIEKEGSRDEEGAPSPKLTKLEIVDEEHKVDYQMIYQPKCLECKIQLNSGVDERLDKAITAIETGTSSLQRNTVQSWQPSKNSCEHVIGVHQLENLPKITQNVKCEDCDLKENLWLCLTCGNLGCGRKHYDGSGGNEHGLNHFQLKGHGACVKLGTITADGTADIYCYRCDDEMIDPELSIHLKPFGIELEEQIKTEKNMMELQLEHNLKYEFNMTTEDGHMLTPLSGPGYTGLKNFGNTCYLNSVLQVLLSIQQFKDFLLTVGKQHVIECYENPLNCLFCQLVKLADGIYSGRYSKLNENNMQDDKQHQEGLTPIMFKKLVGKGHDEFSTMRQQDAYEYFIYLLNQLERLENLYSFDTMGTKLFKFELEQKLQCLQCNKVKYSTSTATSLSLPVPVIKDVGSEEDNKYLEVELEECFKLFFSNETIENYHCPNCKIGCKASKITKFLTYPEVLLISLNRFALINWIPTKLEIPVKMPINNDISQLLQQYKADIHSDEEELLPEDNEVEDEFIANEMDVEQLMMMGFTRNKCIRGLKATNSDKEAAIAWIFDHLEDPDIDEPLSTNSNNNSNNSEFTPTMEQIMILASMGFPEDHAISAIKATNGDMDRAVEWIFNHPIGSIIDDHQTQSQTTDNNNNQYNNGHDNVNQSYKLKSFISHKGTSVHTGHYVAHINLNQEWTLFNDNKVANQPNPPMENAYVYLFQRE
ncbi:ubiquitinyl hydrolase [Neoconidiobolus thromboides FSU 785]|nr:ubiquitinyl hydrolase [Neoconidiobolus thromboides FSU 785]